MAKAAADFLAGRDITVLRSSPLERALETAEPIAAEFGLPSQVDDRLIEPWNHFEGMRFGVGDGALRQPRHWLHLRNPFRPSWGEPYREVAARVLAAVTDAAGLRTGTRRSASAISCPSGSPGGPSRVAGCGTIRGAGECALGSVTSLTFTGGKVTVR